METLIALLHVAAFVMLSLALVVPRLRMAAMITLAVVALAGVTYAGIVDGARSLTTIHSYAGYAGADLEVSMVPFPTRTFTAPGWHWPLVFVGFAVLWVLVLALLGQRKLRNPLLLPLLFAWTATATWLGMQVVAAPAALVQPVGLDRFLWPAGLATALLAAFNSKRFVVLFLFVSSGVLLGRLPAALLSKYTSDAKLGTCLDISSITNIVNPMTQLQFEPQLVAGSGEQQFWLIWLEHVIFFPAIYLMSLLGIAFCAFMFHRHPDTQAERAV